MDRNQIDLKNIDLLNHITDDAPTEEIKNIISLYSVNKDGVEIYNDIKSQPRSSILSTAQHLNIKTTTGYVTTLAKAIIRKLENFLLQECAICKIYYNINRNQKPIIECKLCGQGCHEDCYSSLIPLPGIKFFCSTCDDDKQVVEEDLTNQVRNGDASKTNENANTDDSRINTALTNDEHLTRENKNQQRPICQRYRRGTCPHGISGEREVDGKKCQFSHIKRCQQYCKFGSGGELGCQEGRSCKLMHPVLCKFSVKYRCCLNLDCKFTHLKFTKRYKQHTTNTTISDNTIRGTVAEEPGDRGQTHNSYSQAHHSHMGYRNIYDPMPNIMNKHKDDEPGQHVRFREPTRGPFNIQSSENLNFEHHLPQNQMLDQTRQKHIQSRQPEELFPEQTDANHFLGIMKQIQIQILTIQQQQQQLGHRVQTIQNQMYPVPVQYTNSQVHQQEPHQLHPQHHLQQQIQNQIMTQPNQHIATAPSAPPFSQIQPSNQQLPAPPPVLSQIVNQ